MNSINLNYKNILAEKQIVGYMATDRVYVAVPDCYFTSSRLLRIYKHYQTQYFEHGEYIVESIPDEFFVDLSECMEVATPAKPDTIVAELKKAYMVRELYHLFARIDSQITENPNSIIDACGTISCDVTKMLTQIDDAKDYDHHKSVFDYMLKIEDARKTGKTMRGMKSHLADLDKMISGWETGKVYLISGLEKLGKSRFVRDLTSTWLKDGHGVAIFMLEEDAEAIHECILANRAEVSTDIICTSELSSYKLHHVLQIANKYMEESLYVCNKSGITPETIKNIILRQKVKMTAIGKELKFVIIDYVQRMASEGDGQHEKTERIASELANIARDENICMIEISQMNTGAEKTKNLPLHTQIRFGKVFKEAASCIITLDDPSRRNGEEFDAESESKIIIAHIIQRRGKSNVTIKFVAQLQYSQFHHVARQGDF